MAVTSGALPNGLSLEAGGKLVIEQLNPAEVSPGELVLAVGFGAGLTYAGQVFRCP